MFIAAVVSNFVLVAALVYSAVRKLSGRADVVESYRRAGVPEAWLPSLAVVLLVGACALVVGLALAPVGIAASAGFLVYFLTAIAAHLRAGDAARIATPLAMELLAATSFVLRLSAL